MAGVWLAAVCSAPAAASDPKELGRAAVLGCREHWDRFEYFRIRYLQYGYAGDAPKTLDDSLEFRWPKGKSLKAEYIVDGPKWVLRVDGDDPPFDPKALMKDKKNPGLAWGKPPDTERFLGNGKESLHYIPQDKAGALFEGGAGERRGTNISRTTPLHLLGYRHPDRNPYDLLVAAEREGKPWSAGRPAEVNGSLCVPVTLRTPDDFKAVFHLDLKRGYLPVRVQIFVMKDGKEVEGVRTDAIEVRECSRNRWLPTKVREVNFPATQGRFMPNVREVTEFDVDTRPTREQLGIEMEAGASITRQSDTKADSVALRQGERVHPDDLVRFIEISEGRQVNPLTDTAIHPAPTWKWRWYAGPAVVVAAAVAVGYRRYRRGRAATA